MTKKVYKINVWFNGDDAPETLATLPRGSYDEEFDAFEDFRWRANMYLARGYNIAHITHHWNYEFTKPGERSFILYMFESFFE